MIDWLKLRQAMTVSLDARSKLNQSIGLPKINNRSKSRKFGLAGIGALFAAALGGWGWLSLGPSSNAAALQQTNPSGDATSQVSGNAQLNISDQGPASTTIKIDGQTFKSSGGNLNKTIVTDNGGTHINISVHSESKTEKGSSSQQNSTVEATSSSHQTIITNETTEIIGP